MSPAPEIRRVHWSGEAMVRFGDECYSAFQRNSYHARVEFEDGEAVIVVLPEGAALRPPVEWEDEVREAAREAYGFGCCTFLDPEAA